MPVVKHLYALTHGSTYCTCRLLTVTLPVGVCALMCWAVAWGYAGAMGGGYVIYTWRLTQIRFSEEETTMVSSRC